MGSQRNFQQALADVTGPLESLRLQKSPPSVSRAKLQQLMKAKSPNRVQEPLSERQTTKSNETGETPQIGFPNLESLASAARNCQRCPHLVSFRTGVVVGVGNPNADLMFVGEAPGADEDRQGEPFVGRAGQLLTKMIQAMGFEREDVYIANILKCRPDMPEGVPGNRKPKNDEMATCIPWLKDQIRLIKPKALVALGATAAEGLLHRTEALARLRGQWNEFEEIPVMVTYHPAYLLRNQSITEKRKVWEDLLMVLEKLGATITQKQRGYFLKK